jgi:hypothetical protein
MTQIEKTIIKLHRDGFVAEAIAQAIGEDRSYVGFVIESYMGRASHHSSEAAASH